MTTTEQKLTLARDALEDGRRPTLARLKELLHYNPETGVFVRVKAPKGKIAGQIAGSISKTGHIHITMDKVRYLAHRLAWLYVYGEWPSTKVDHRDQNPSNNRIDNLRLASDSQNTTNAKLSSRNTSGARGVRIYNGKFMPTICVNRKVKWLGTYPTLDEAAHAYNKAAIEVHGEFAVLNPIGVDYE